MLDFQAIEKPTMDRIDLILSLLLHKEYAKEDEMKLVYSMLIQVQEDKHDELVVEDVEEYIHMFSFA
jgi:hypothetical protein